ncbi:ribonuclease T2-like protein [Flagelloscypha sp. PMI_526]|nr:ribonuclease T2-like protein [Flagelloscypha sp. PMI_526]
MVLSVILVALAAFAAAETLVPENQIVLDGLLRPKAEACRGSMKQSCKDGHRGGTCCFEAPGGLLMQTQLWDADTDNGPEDSWTIHGLWPDNCDGTFDKSCDPHRAYKHISSLLSNAGASDTLDFMENCWKSSTGHHEQFWEHEWSKHGTCMSTFSADCFSGDKGSEAVAFFETVVSLFKTLPTYDFLKAEGIEPRHEPYEYSKVKAALSRAVGGIEVQVLCNGDELSSVAYYFNLIGSPINGEWVHVNAVDKSESTEEGECGDNVVYKPKPRSDNKASCRASRNAVLV